MSEQKSDSEKILKMNRLFYEALGNRNFNLMKQVWVNGQKVGCIHPGWTILRSWDAIMQSWENIFDPDDKVDIHLSNIRINIKENIAWLTCVQEMTYINRNPVSFNLSQSTNIFEKSKNEWKMVIHHASPIPAKNNKSEYENLQ